MNDQDSRNAGQVIPPPVPPPMPQRPGDATGGLIPYKNAPALAAYYLGVFSVIPLIGTVLGLAALVLGIMGLRMAARRPEVKGKVHAWVGIIVGGFFGLGYLALTVLIVVGVIMARSGAY
jgi:hypothetical protein